QIRVPVLHSPQYRRDHGERFTYPLGSTGDQRRHTDQLTAAVSAIEEIMTVELTAYGFATATPSGDGYKFECQHGADECYGNKIVACTKKYITSEKTFLDFTLCLMDEGSYPPINGKMCAEKMGFKWDPIKECVDSVEGQQLLYQEGVKQNRLSPAVDYIPWIIINDVFSRANLDEAQVDLIGLVCNTYTGTPPNGCK
ncbi:GILT-like 2, partial [Homarus americanus]